MKVNKMVNENRTKRNGGNLSFTEAAEAWSKEPHIYEVSTEPTSKWAAEWTKKQQAERTGNLKG